MDDPPALSLAEQIGGAQEWWRDAGVDYIFHDERSSWFEKEEAKPARAAQKAPAAPPAEKPKPAIGGNPETWPQDVAGFREWWISEESLDEGGAYPRVPPRGEAGAALMVLVPEPEEEDRESLLSGPQGRLIAGILSAMEIPPESSYLAAALPRHTPVPDWTGLAESGLGAVLLHHIALARPRRLLILGQNILPLLGHDPAQPPATIRETPVQSGQIPTLAARGARYLLDRADARASLWQRWLDWTHTERGSDDKM